MVGRNRSVPSHGAACLAVPLRGSEQGGLVQRFAASAVICGVREIICGVSEHFMRRAGSPVRVACGSALWAARCDGHSEKDEVRVYRV